MLQEQVVARATILTTGLSRSRVRVRAFAGGSKTFERSQGWCIRFPGGPTFANIRTLIRELDLGNQRSTIVDRWLSD